MSSARGSEAGGSGAESSVSPQAQRLEREASDAQPSVRQARGNGRTRLKGLAVPVAILLLLEIAVRVGWVQSYQMPAPSEIASTLMDLADGALWKHIGASLTRVLSGFVIGAGLALVFAAWQRNLRRLVANAYHMALHTTYSALAGVVAAPTVPPEAASGRLPYAIAIAVATVGCVLWLRVHGALPL